MEKVNVLLPMKGHSERVPNKNLKQFYDGPLYHAILETLRECSLVNEIFINTDSEEIKADAGKHFPSVLIVDRPKRMHGDHVSMNKIISHDLSQINGEHFLQTHSTNPLLKRETLENAMECYFQNLGKYDSVFSVTKWQTRLFKKNGQPLNHNPDELKRTQDLAPVYEENSNFYIFSKGSFKRAGNKRIGPTPYMYSVNKLEAIDIDEPEDFKLAELLYKNFN